MTEEHTCSLEFFPPKTPSGREKLINDTLPSLSLINHSYCSVTYGAGGSTRDNTLGTVTALQGCGERVAPHLSFGAPAGPRPMPQPSRTGGARSRNGAR